MKPLRLATWNVAGLENKKYEIELLMDEQNLDIVLVTEAHCKSSSNISFRGCCTYFTAHPNDTAQDGTAIVIRSHIKHHVLPEYKTTGIQATSIEIRDRCGPLVISSVYCATPIITADMFTDFFDTLGSRFIVGADWNAKHTVWGSRRVSTRGRQLKYSVDNNDLIVVSTRQPTYWPTDLHKIPDLVDFFVTKGMSENDFEVESCYDSSSDHSPVLLTVNIEATLCTKPEILYNPSTDWYSFREFINNNIMMPRTLSSKRAIEEYTMHITSLIRVASKKSTPQREEITTRNIPQIIKNKIIERRNLRRVWQETRPATRKDELNKVTAELKKMMEDYYLENQNVASDLNESFRSEDTKLPLKTSAGWARTDQAKADELAKYLSNVYTPNNITNEEEAQNEDTPSNQINPGISSEAEASVNSQTINETLSVQSEHGDQFHQSFEASTSTSSVNTDQEKVDEILSLSKVYTPNLTTIEEYERNRSTVKPKTSPSATPVSVQEIQRKLKSFLDATTGYDLITVDILKELPKQALVFLAVLFDSILRVQYFPRLWKIALITMVYDADINNNKPYEEANFYKPIMTLPVLSQLFEKILLDRILPVLSNNRIIPAHQSGFSKRHSKIDQARRVCDIIKETLDDKEFCCFVSLKIEQAFDKVWHCGLLHKLKSDLPYCYYDLLKSYICQRKFKISVGDALSDCLDVNAGVPQGTELGQILYMIYTADLPRTGGVAIATYLDDIALLASHTDSAMASARMQRALNKINIWLRNYRINVNISESVQATFSLRRRDCELVQLGGNTLPQVDSVTYLGMHFDRRLTWGPHILSVKHQLQTKYNSLKHLMKNPKISRESKLRLYEENIKPIWMYGIQLWGTACESNINNIQRVQDTILKEIWNEYNTVNVSEIHEYLGMPTVLDEIDNINLEQE